MDDDTLATVIPFPCRRGRGEAPIADPDTEDLERYWTLVQRLAAERRELAGAG